MPIITLTTDFGTRDGYVGAMKGVLVSRTRHFAPSTIVDIAHDIPPGDIAHAAWVVATACREFPPTTIHIVVVDPGVGGARRGVVVQHDTSFYVGPDNGTFAYLTPNWVRAIENRRVMATNVSATFHGRDVFAPVAAYIAADQETAVIGSTVVLEGKLPWGPRPVGEGRVVHVDRFGNLITDLPASEAGGAVAIAGRQLPIVRTYSDVPSGELLAYIGSADTLEIAMRNGRADKVLDAPRGTPVLPIADVGAYR
jgi:S-adenosylmethionine hydrolase